MKQRFFVPNNEQSFEGWTLVYSLVAFIHLVHIYWVLPSTVLLSQDKTVINNKAIMKCFMRERALPICFLRNVFWAWYVAYCRMYFLAECIIISDYKDQLVI